MTKYYQMDSDNKREEVDVSKYSIKIICHEPGCFHIRYIRPCDRAKVRFCKPHQVIYRLRYRAEFMRDDRRNKK